MKSSLARLAPLSRQPDVANAKKAAREAWHRDGIVLVNPAWFQNWADRKQAELLAEKLYGKRRTS